MIDKGKLLFYNTLCTSHSVIYTASVLTSRSFYCHSLFLSGEPGRDVNLPSLLSLSPFSRSLIHKV